HSPLGLNRDDWGIPLTTQPIPFLTPNGGVQTSGAKQAFIYFGPNPALFREIFTGVGAVRVPKKAPPRASTKKVSRRRTSNKTPRRRP
ncbi:hypothetical protein, partial [Rhodoblastus sp.]|uniref:hypothetical protein n=1 Tax=Rhodoblastus sp. TaxID=1962975 RepID=UPI003F94D9AB